MDVRRHGEWVNLELVVSPDIAPDTCGHCTAVSGAFELTAVSGFLFQASDRVRRSTCGLRGDSQGDHINRRNHFSLYAIAV